MSRLGDNIIYEDGNIIDLETGEAWDSVYEYLLEPFFGVQINPPMFLVRYIIGTLYQMRVRLHGNLKDGKYMFFVHWANEKDYADCGYAVRTSWLTEKGEELLEDLLLVKKYSDKKEIRPKKKRGKKHPADSQVELLTDIFHTSRDLQAKIKVYKTRRFVRPYCPDCSTYMKKEYINSADGWLSVWTCKCKAPDSLIKAYLEIGND